MIVTTLALLLLQTDSDWMLQLEDQLFFGTTEQRVQALREVVSQEGAEGVGPLLAEWMIQESNRDALLAGLQAVRQHHPDDMAEAVGSLLNHQDSQVIGAALFTLAELEQPANVDVVNGLLDREDVTIREAWVAYLNAHPSPEGFDALQAALEERDEAWQDAGLIRAFQAMAEHDPARAEVYLPSQLERGLSPTVRGAILIQLAQLGDSSRFDDVRRALTDGDLRLARAALAAVPHLPNEMAEELARDGLRDDRDEIRAEAALILSEHPLPSLERQLRFVAREESIFEVRVNAIRALIALPSPEFWGELMQASRDGLPDPRIRAAMPLMDVMDDAQRAEFATAVLESDVVSTVKQDVLTHLARVDAAAPADAIWAIASAGADGSSQSLALRNAALNLVIRMHRSGQSMAAPMLELLQNTGRRDNAVITAAGRLRDASLNAHLLAMVEDVTLGVSARYAAMQALAIQRSPALASSLMGLRGSIQDDYLRSRVDVLLAQYPPIQTDEAIAAAAN